MKDGGAFGDALFELELIGDPVEALRWSPPGAATYVHDVRLNWLLRRGSRGRLPINNAQRVVATPAMASTARRCCFSKDLVPVQPLGGRRLTEGPPQTKLAEQQDNLRLEC